MSGIVDKTRRKEKTLSNAQKVEIARGNHIWINAFQTVKPSPESLQEIGRMVIAKVLESDVGDDLSGSFPVTWIEVNAS
jgi:hypothetical protein